MDKVKTKISILCADHEDQPLVKVDPDSSAVKHVHCLDCLMQTEDPKAQYLKFPKISDFLTTTAAIFAEQKSQINLTSEVPKEFLEVAARQAESLEKLSKHIDGEKKKIEIFFENIRNVIIDALDQLKIEYLEKLDKQVTNLHEIYTRFEKMLKRVYPKKEDIERMFPTKEDLESRLEKIVTATGLNDFFKELKQTIKLNKEDILSYNSSDELKQSYFGTFSTKLKEIESSNPIFEEKGSNFEETKNKIKEHLQQLLDLEKIFTLKNPISTDLAELNIQSTIINSEDFEILKEWLPDNYKFNPTLLYRLTRDGKSSQTFRSLCVKKGPTITLIRCKYDGASQSSIIGGFVDQDFDKTSNKFIRSSQAFIFSLHEKDKIKCPILKPDYAFSNSSGNEIWFGHSGTIGTFSNFENCYSFIWPPSSDNNTYENCSKIIPPESLRYQLGINFAVEELEVYTVSKLN